MLKVKSKVDLPSLPNVGALSFCQPSSQIRILGLQSLDQGRRRRVERVEVVDQTPDVGGREWGGYGGRREFGGGRLGDLLLLLELEGG